MQSKISYYPHHIFYLMFLRLLIASFYERKHCINSKDDNEFHINIKCKNQTNFLLIFMFISTKGLKRERLPHPFNRRTKSLNYNYIRTTNKNMMKIRPRKYTQTTMDDTQFNQFYVKGSPKSNYGGFESQRTIQKKNERKNTQFVQNQLQIKQEQTYEILKLDMFPSSFNTYQEETSYSEYSESFEIWNQQTMFDLN